MNRSGRLRPQSRKKQKENRTRRRVITQLAEERGPWCELRTPACTGRWQHGHELVGSDVGSRIDPRNILLACDPCNTWVEDQPAYARHTGKKCPRWDAVQGIGGLVPSPDWRSRHGGQSDV